MDEEMPMWFDRNALCHGGASSGIAAGQRGCSRPEDQITQIYEGTNQVQRIVMARQLLAGVQSEL